MKRFILGIIFFFLLIYILIQIFRCNIAVKNGKKELSDYCPQKARLSYGDMSYVDRGSGTTVLSIHGIFGGYDQAYETCKDFDSVYRIIAPSRFGYPGSDICGDGTPKEQAKAYSELLDKLGIDKVFLLATSAGGSVAIRFALDYPERTMGVILYCSAMPFKEKPVKYVEYAGPPKFMCNDLTMFLMSPLFGPIMGMDSSTIYSMMPVTDRRQGVILDAAVTNPDMARNFETYEIEKIKLPVLILHSKDDKLVNYEDTVNSLTRFSNYKFVSFEEGGHLMVGHEAEVKEAVIDFIAHCIRS